MERGKFSLDDLFDRADTWCVANLPVEPVQLGVHKREVVAVDSSTIARWRATARTALLGKGYWHRAGRAVHQHRGGRHPGRVDRWGAGRLGPAGPLWGQLRRGGGAVFADLPPSAVPRLLAVDAGIATQKQFAAATARDALTGRLRINCKLRGAPPPAEPARAAAHARGGFASRGGPARSGAGRGLHPARGEGRGPGAAQHLAF